MKKLFNKSTLKATGYCNIFCFSLLLLIFFFPLFTHGAETKHYFYIVYSALFNAWRILPSILGFWAKSFRLILVVVVWNVLFVMISLIEIILHCSSAVKWNPFYVLPFNLSF